MDQRILVRKKVLLSFYAVKGGIVEYTAVLQKRARKLFLSTFLHHEECTADKIQCAIRIVQGRSDQTNIGVSASCESALRRDCQGYG